MPVDTSGHPDPPLDASLSTQLLSLGSPVNQTPPLQHDIKLADFDNADTSFAADPDHPHALLMKGSNKHDRLPHSGVETVLATCVQ